MRVVLDTNVVISAIISATGPPARIRAAWRNEIFEVAVSRGLVDEYRCALSYPKIRSRYGLSAKEIDETCFEFFTFGVHVEDFPIDAVVLNDPADDTVLACAIAGSADYIVTGDRHLLSIGEYQGIKIVTPAVFIQLLKQS